MRTRIVGAALGASILAATACGPPGSSAMAPRADLLLVRAGGALSAVDVAGRAVRFTRAGGIASFDFRQVYGTEPNGAQQRLVAIATDTGERRPIATTAPGFEVRAVSRSGRSIALAPDDSAEVSGGYLAPGRARTDLIVVDTGSGDRRSFHLEGNFVPEAFSTDDRFLYLIEYLPATRPDRYAVRQMNLRNGRVWPIGLRVKLPAPDVMRGTGRMQLPSPNGKRLYTLYTKQPVNRAHELVPVTRSRSGDHVHAFVHVLSLRGRWAHCIDLPMPFGTGLATGHGMAISDDGSTMFVADPSNDILSVIDTSSLKVRQTVGVELGEADGDGLPMSVGGGVLYIGARTGVIALPIDGLFGAAPEPLWRRSLPASATGMRVTPDGEILYVSLDSEILILDASDGTELDRLPLALGGTIAHVSG